MLVNALEVTDSAAEREAVWGNGFRISLDDQSSSRLTTGLGGTGQTLEGDLEQTSLATKSRWGQGDEIWLHRLLNCQGWYYIELWDLERATQFNRDGAAGARKRADPETAANAEANLGDIFTLPARVERQPPPRP